MTPTPAPPAAMDVGEYRARSRESYMGWSKGQLVDLVFRALDRIAALEAAAVRFTARSNPSYFNLMEERDRLRAQLTDAQSNERLMLETLSQILTGGNAGTWDQIEHAATAAQSSRRERDEAVWNACLHTCANWVSEADGSELREFCGTERMALELHALAALDRGASGGQGG